MSRVVKQLRRTFDDSWLNTAERDVDRARSKVGLLDVAVQQRQGSFDAAVVDEAGRPFTVSALVGVLNRTIRQLEESPGYAAPVHATVGCVLLGELCGSALCRLDKDAGGIYPRLACGTEAWQFVHEPLYYLRHAVFHPGSVVRAAASRRGGGAIHVDTLRLHLTRRRDPTSTRLVKELERSRANIAGEWAALWALERTIEMGDYELRAIAGPKEGNRS